MSYNVAVVGATGNVGREILQILAERQFPIKNIDAVASSRSVGREISFGDEKILKAKNLDNYDFSQTDIVFSSPGAKISKDFAPKAAKAGAVIIDNTSHFRMDDNVALVVPEVNPHALKDYKKSNIIANPNCSTIQMVTALKPLHDIFTIKRIVVSTYQSVSGAGKEAMDELFNQTRAIYVNDPIEKTCFTKQIAFNCIPHIDSFMDDGATKEEWKMRVETQKILDARINVIATCVRVPVFIGHGEAITIECEKPITDKQAIDILRNAPNVSVIDHRQDEGYVSVMECAGEDAVFVSRIRQDTSVPNGLALWCVSDNLRKGAALNAVQIAESLIKQNLI